MFRVAAAVLILSLAAFAQIVNPGGGGSPAFSSVTGGSNTSTLNMSGAGNLSPLNTGQIAASADWYQNGPGVQSPVNPTLSFSASGGTISSTTVVYVKITFVGPAVIEPSGEVKIAVSGCTGGNQCSVTVNMPASCTSPSGAVTGCTVWDSTTTGTEKQQAASAACVNITSATCVIGTIAAGSTLVTPSTTGITPVGAQANTCPDNIIPTNWLQAADGNYYPYAGVDISALNGLTSPPGTFTICNRFFVNDTSGPPVISNAMVSFHHQAGNNTSTGSTFDDRALGIEMIDSGTATPTFDQSLTQYNERVVSNNSFACNPINGGAAAGESCAAAGRFVSSDLRTAHSGASFLVGVAGVASTNTATAQETGFTYGIIGGQFGAYQGTVNNQNGSSNSYVGVEAQASASSGNTSGNGAGVVIQAPTIRFATLNRGLWVENFGTTSQYGGTGNDFNIFSTSIPGTPTNGKNYFQGNVYLPNILGNDGATIGITNSTSTQGSVATTKLGTPAQIGSIANVGTPGATSYSYAMVCKDGMGNVTAGGTAKQTTTGNATLNSSNFNQFQFPVPPAAVGCDVYRTQSAGTPSSIGKIGSISTNDPYLGQSVAGIVFQDQGLAGDGTTIPSVDTTGGLSVAGIAILSGNISRLTSDTVLNADTALHTVFSFNLGVTAQTYNFHCAGSYSQATAATANNFGVQAALNNPTNLMANGTVQISVGPPSTYTSATLATLATTTATNVVTFTPGAITTNYTWQLDGQIEQPANTGGQTLNIMASTGSASDALTIKRGSYCRLY